MPHLLLYIAGDTDFGADRNPHFKSQETPEAYLKPSKEGFTMQRNLVTAILLAALFINLCLCRRASTPGKRNKKAPPSSGTKLPTPTSPPTVQGNLCRSGQLIDNVALRLDGDLQFYRANWKDFPDGLYYPNCSFLLQPNVSKEVLVDECVSFTVTSSNLDLPEGKNATDQRARVMWHVINHLCAHETCHQPCPRSSSTGGPWHLGRLLIMSLIGCFFLSTE
ncbi:prion-like protein doppel [Hemicordylus capensis]|uniref:prion-like protein doppel n=1 Tax=Hemicordylus capensis TaxID=884348 RepID=UPI002303E1A5|nr:prion-like protein doppel [Hemicordylus capensis]